MKVLLSVALIISVLSVCVFFVGCGDDDDDSEDSPSDDDDADDDADDDELNDDADDDTDDDDDVNDDLDDDLNDDVDDDSAEPTTTTTTISTTSTTTTTVPLVHCYQDADTDTFGEPGFSHEYESETCPSGWVLDNTDCDDANILVHPGAEDDGIPLVDFNCDGVVGDAQSGDADGDGFALLGTSGGIIDCDDFDDTCFPGAAPLDDPVACMRDRDGDDYGDDQAAPPINPGTDCDDNDLLSYPGAPELPDDGIDQNCDDHDLLLGDETGVFVAMTGDDANPGTMAAPKMMINAGMVLATQTGKSVFVAEGDYSENVEVQVSIFGGYESAGWTRDINTYVTTIYGQAGAAVKISAAGSIAVEGFTINGVNGGLPDSGSYGVRNGDGAATLVNNTIDGGAAGSSYGVYNYEGGTVTLVNNIIDGGSGGRKCCGVYNSGSTTILVNNTINGGSGNRSRGVTNSGELAIATVVNNVIDGGSGTYSMGILITASSTTTLSNNDIWGADLYCMIFKSYWPSGGCVVNSIAGVNACGWTGCVEASGNISADPLFVDPVGGDFHLGDSSPCIDAGIDPAAYVDPGLVEFDFDGDARPYGAGWDIGADEWTP